MPAIETREEQIYVGKRATMSLRELATGVPRLMTELADWLAKHDIEPTGHRLLRFHVIDMPDRLQIEAGLPVLRAPRADAGIAPGILPAGRYATSTFTGASHGVEANKQLINWITAQGETIDMHATDEGDAFASRFETYLTDARREPDPGKWKIDIAMKLRAASADQSTRSTTSPTM